MEQQTNNLIKEKSNNNMENEEKRKENNKLNFYKSKNIKSSIRKWASPSIRKKWIETELENKRKTEKIMKIEVLEVNLEKVCINMEKNKIRSYAQYIKIKKNLSDLRKAYIST